MFECKFCGHTSDNPRAKFCAECGPEGPAVRWTDEEVDKLSNIERYVELLGSLPDLSGAAALEEQTKSLREKLKISHSAHQLAIEATFAKVSGSANSDQLAVFYNSNFSEAYAGHDTFIEFRFDNRTEDKFFKARLEWNDVDTDSRIDLKLSVDRY